MDQARRAGCYWLRLRPDKYLRAMGYTTSHRSDGDGGGGIGNSMGDENNEK